MNIFTLNDNNNVSDKINLDDLYEKKREIDESKMHLYNKILNRIHIRIKTTSNQKKNEHHCWYVVPEMMIGVPRYDYIECTSYIIEKLTDNGFIVKYTNPNLLFISWNHWVPGYARQEFKKKTGVAIDGYGNKLEKDEKEDMEDKMDDEEIDLDDMSEDDLKSFIEDVIADMVTAGELEAGEEFEVEDEVEVDDEVEVEIDEEEKVDEDVTIDEDARTDAEEKGYKDGIKDAKADAKKEIDDIKLEEKEDELKEAYATVETLRNELNEINLLNAKLLYTNKIFKSKNLTEHNKVKVLTSFDKAETVKEAKLIYETLKDGLTEKKVKKTVNESISMASKSVGVGPKKVDAKPIVESNQMVDRFKKLAGII